MENLKKKLLEAGVLTETEELLEKKEVVSGYDTCLFLDEEGDVKLLWILDPDRVQDFSAYRKFQKEEKALFSISEEICFEAGERRLLAVKTEYAKPFRLWLSQTRAAFGSVPPEHLWALTVTLLKVVWKMEQSGARHPYISEDTVFQTGFRKTSFLLGDFFLEEAKEPGTLETCVQEIGLLLYDMLNGTVSTYEELKDQARQETLPDPVYGRRSWKDAVRCMLQFRQDSEQQGEAGLKHCMEVLALERKEEESDWKYGKNLYEKAREAYFQGDFSTAEELAEQGEQGAELLCKRLTGCIFLKQGQEEEALDYFEDAAEQGDPVSACYLSRLLFSNARSPVDFKEVERYVRQGERAELPMAWYDLGLYYDSGKAGFPCDREKAMEYMKKSASCSYRKALEYLSRYSQEQEYWEKRMKEEILLKDPV